MTKLKSCDADFPVAACCSVINGTPCSVQTFLYGMYDNDVNL